MLNILIAEGTPAVWQAERTRFGIPSNFSLLAAAVQLHRPGIRSTLLNIADGEALAFGTALSDFDGVMIPGSPLHIYDPTPSVTRQIDFARAALAAGAGLGELLGLQLATVALGGSVRRNPRGRELPIARAITVTEVGRAHPLLASRPAVFDALCSHLDEIETLPRLPGFGGERTLLHSGDSHKNPMRGQLSRHAVSPRAHSGGLGGPHRDQSQDLSKRALAPSLPRLSRSQPTIASWTQCLPAAT